MDLGGCDELGVLGWVDVTGGMALGWVEVGVPLTASFYEVRMELGGCGWRHGILLGGGGCVLDRFLLRGQDGVGQMRLKTWHWVGWRWVVSLTTSFLKV